MTLLRSWLWNGIGVISVIASVSLFTWLALTIRLASKRQRSRRAPVVRKAKPVVQHARKAPNAEEKPKISERNAAESEHEARKPEKSSDAARRKKLARALRKRMAARILQRLARTIVRRRTLAATMIGRWLRIAVAMRHARSSWLSAYRASGKAARMATLSVTASVAWPLQVQLRRRFIAKSQAATVMIGLYRMYRARVARRVAAARRGALRAIERRARFERCILLLQRRFTARRARHLVVAAEVIAEELAALRREERRREEKRLKERYKRQLKKERRAAAEAAALAASADANAARERLWSQLFFVRLTTSVFGGRDVLLFRRVGQHPALVCRTTSRTVYIFQAERDRCWVVGDEAAKEARERRGWLLADEGAPGSLPQHFFARGGDLRGSCEAMSRSVVATDDAVRTAAAAAMAAAAAAKRAHDCRIVAPKSKRKGTRIEQAAQSRAYRLAKVADATLSRALEMADVAHGDDGVRDVRQRRKQLLAELGRHGNLASASTLECATNRITLLDKRLAIAKSRRDADRQACEDDLAGRALDNCCDHILEEVILATCRSLKASFNRDRRRAAKAARTALSALAADAAADAAFFFFDDDAASDSDERSSVTTNEAPL